MGLATKTISNAHGCDPASAQNCWVDYIQQLSAENSNYIVTNGDDFLIKMWRLANTNGSIDLQPVCTLTGHKNWVYQTIEVESVPNMLASASLDGTIRLWKISNCKFFKELDAKASVNSLENFPGGKYILSGDESGKIIKWNVETGESTTFAQLPSGISDIYLLGSNNQYLGATTAGSTGQYFDGGSLWVFDVAKSGFDFNTTSTYDKIYFVFGDTFLDDKLSLDLPAGSLNAHTNAVNGINPLNEDLVATASDDRTTKVWSLSNKKLAHSFKYHTDVIWFALDHVVNPTSPNSFYLIAGSLDQNLNVYSIPPKSGVDDLSGKVYFDRGVTSLSIVSNERRLKAFVGLNIFGILFCLF
jgi:WD40 repeat protein